jgi:hypothetical protein
MRNGRRKLNGDENMATPNWKRIKRNASLYTKATLARRIEKMENGHTGGYSEEDAHKVINIYYQALTKK